jgi:hypothetical protein
MPENDTSWHAVKGPKLDSLSCKENLYTLASLFFASSHIAGLADDEVGCPFRQMLDEHEESLITQLLIETAVLIRMKDDLFQQQHGIPADTQKDIVGTLWIPADASQDSQLHLREACNKIIHAKLINFDLIGEPHAHDRYLQPVVYLYGEQRGTPWKAQIDVVRWVEFGYTMFP